MKRRATTGGKAAKTRRRKTTNIKRRTAPAIARRDPSSEANLQEEVRAVTRQLAEALEQQTATAQVLNVISSSPGDLQPVFAAILENATRICEARFGNLFLYDGKDFHNAYMHRAPRAFAKHRRRNPLVGENPKALIRRLAKTKQAIHITDVTEKRLRLQENDPSLRQLAELAGARTLLIVPMLKDGELVGSVNIYRQQVRPFTDKQIGLLTNFAAQAVIAIENTRLLNELRQRTADLSESLEQQTATSEVLSVISSSPGELEPVFRAMVENATRICEAKFGNLALLEGDQLRIVALHGAPPAFEELRRRDPLIPIAITPLGQILETKQAVHVADLAAQEPYASSPLVKLAGARSLVGVPLVKEDNLVGVLSIYREEVRPFTDKQVELLKNFAAQAVIAIENTRLLNELRGSLDRQTAMSEVLSVISSSPGEVKPVFEAMLANAIHICEAQCGFIYRMEAGVMRAMAEIGVPSALAEYRRNHPHTGGATTTVDVMRATKKPAHVHDGRESEAYRMGNPNAVAAVDLGGSRTALYVPMLKEDEIVGVINVYRQDVRPFADDQIALLENFAAQAVIAIENARLLSELRHRTNDLSEALEQQTATSEVLKVISSSPGDLQPVFDVLLANATRMCGAKFGALSLHEGNAFRSIAMIGAPPAFASRMQRDPLIRVTPGHNLERLVLTKAVVHIPDLETDKDAAPIPYELAGARAALNVPLLKDDLLIGSLLIYRQEKGAFGDKQIELVKNFAAQAVIAIENARLLSELHQRTNDLSESLQQQTATADVLKVISGTPGELQPVFDTMLAKATELCDASYGALWLRVGDAYRFAAIHGDLPYTTFTKNWQDGTLYRVKPEVPLARIAVTLQPVQVADMRLDPAYLSGDPLPVSAVEIAGIRTLITVPMLKERELIGAIAIYRKEVRPFTDKQVELVTNFAAQVVIAIENGRLLNELRESLQQQTATAEVLKVISRSTFDLKTVLNTLVESASRLCNAYDSVILLRQNDSLVFGAHHGPIPMDFDKWPITRAWTAGRSVEDRKPIHVHDLATADDEFPEGQAMALRLGHRTILSVPLLREDEAIGSLSIRRTEVRPFTDKEVALARTFADQAVIAIENVRLFDEVQARTSDLAESLEQQTATSEVLKVISSSPGELEPVFQAMLENATRLCEANFGILYRFEDGAFRATALRGAPPAFAEFQQNGPIHPTPASGLGRITSTRRPVHITDSMAEQRYIDGDPYAVNAVKLSGSRTLIFVPMLKDDELVGTITIYRKEMRPFTEKQIELVSNFAAQAVIAIENTRLLNELRESLQQQTATADVLKVISRSTFDLKVVLDTLVNSAARLCRAEKANIAIVRNDTVDYVAQVGFPPDFLEYMQSLRLQVQRGSVSGRAALEGKIVHVPDVLADPEFVLLDAQKVGGFRSALGVPLMRERTPIGTMFLSRPTVEPFTQQEIELVTTFADQAVIAIENTRLLNELRQRTDDLTESLEDLRTAQDRLVQTEKLASLGQLTAGIAHEIKNPLNFVNNFSAISIELIDELREALAGAHLDSKLRAEVSEIADMLKGNLDKVVQHGKRADSIVKNMLLHSRQGSGEHRPVDINAVVEESLNLAYHGARAEKQGFNITLEKSLDPAAGEVDLFPQEITRVLLNLISNGFYAATKRKAEANGGSYEPTLSAATKDLGDRVEIRIRDNGTGIPPEVKEKMFNPFFTTKPAGEGTGLGLSLSYDIIVKQHAGSIEVDTQPGEFTEFRIVLPRGAATIAKLGERA